MSEDHRTIPREDALRFALVAAEAHVAHAAAERAEAEAARQHALAAQRSIEAREILARHGIDPAARAVITRDDAPYALGTVIDQATGQPLPAGHVDLIDLGPNGAATALAALASAQRQGDAAVAAAAEN